MIHPVLDALQWPGMVLGLAGAACVASGRRTTRLRGFQIWVLSNICWIIWAAATAGWGLLIMQIVFCATSCLGWANHRREPQRDPHA